MRIEDAAKILSVFMGALDILPELLEDVKRTPFYRQKLKNLCNALAQELDAHMQTVCREAAEVAYTEDWLNQKLLVSLYLRCIRKTQIGKLGDFMAFLSAWENGEVIQQDDLPITASYLKESGWEAQDGSWRKKTERWVITLRSEFGQHTWQVSLSQGNGTVNMPPIQYIYQIQTYEN